MNFCSATVASTGDICGCRVNGSGNRCGRHGGLSQTSVIRLNLGLTVNICSAIVASTGLRCTCQATYGRDRCNRHRGWMSRSFRGVRIDPQDLEAFITEFGGLEVKKEVEMECISKFYCCICMEDVDSENAGYQMNCCKKGFCVGCINEWVEKSTSCPHCRAVIN